LTIASWDVSVRFNETWGPREQLEIDPIDAWPLLKEALERDESWGARLPSGITAVETLASRKPRDQDAADALLVHPMGSLEVRQNVLPLEIKLQKVGSAPLEKPTSFSIERVTVVRAEDGSNLEASSDEEKGDVEVVSDVEEDFARAQFVYLSDDERLTRPSFEKMTAGVTLGGDRIAFGSPVRMTGGAYETILIHDDQTSSETALGADGSPAGSTTLDDSLRSDLAASSAARCALRKSGRRKYALAGKQKALKLLNERFEVVDADSGQAVPIPDVKKAMGRLRAEQAMADLVATQPKLAARLRVTPIGGLAR
jgi:hypothetical protein